MENQPKGTVTPLASTFPIEEAQNAARRVEESLEQPRKELQKLKEFIEDNRKLMKLVQKLPDEVSYNIMVCSSIHTYNFMTQLSFLSFGFFHI
jgi:unconventional prefoldin RPB5 interactor 1